MSYDAAASAYAWTAWWKLGDSSGSTTAADSSGNGNTATVDGSDISFGNTAGPTGDTSAEGVGSSIGSLTTSLQGSGTTFTLVAWFNYINDGSQTTNGMFLENTGGSSTKGVALYLSTSSGANTTLTCQCGLFGSGPSVTTSLAAGTWHMAAATFDGTDIRLYLDGSLIGSPTAATLSWNGTDTWTMFNFPGASGGSDAYHGYLAEVSIMQGSAAALSASQIQALYESAFVTVDTGGGPPLPPEFSGLPPIGPPPIVAFIMGNQQPYILYPGAGAPIVNFNQNLTAGFTFTGSAFTKATTIPLAASPTMTGSFTKKTKFNLAASLTKSGALTKKTALGLAASLTNAGAFTKKTTAALSATLGKTGTLTKKTLANLTAAPTFTGALSRRTAYNLPGGTLSTTGSFSKRTILALAATLAMAGAISRKTLAGLVASLTNAGSLTKRTTFKLAAATQSFAGSFIASPLFTKSLSAGLSLAGSMTKRTTAALTANLHSSGAISRATTYLLSGNLTLANHIFVVGVHAFFSAGMSMTGALAKRTTLNAFNGAQSFAGSLHKATTAKLTATLTNAGALTKKTTAALAASLSLAGAITKKTALTLTATLAKSGSLTKQTKSALSASVSLAGSLSRKTLHHLVAAVLTASGALTGSITFTKVFAAGLSFAGAITKRTKASLSAHFSPAGSLTKKTSTAFAATLHLAGSFTKQTHLAFGGGLSFAGSISRGIRKALAGAASFVGHLVTAISTTHPQAGLASVTLSADSATVVLAQPLATIALAASGAQISLLAPSASIVLATGTASMALAVETN